MENRKLYTACQGKCLRRMGSPSVGASASQRSPPETRTPKTPERSAQPTEIQKGDTMSIFKKPEKGFLAKLFKHKQVEELAEELAYTYAEEMQADMLSDNPETDTAEDTAAEPVPMLEVTESGEIDFTEPPNRPKPPRANHHRRTLSRAKSASTLSHSE